MPNSELSAEAKAEQRTEDEETTFRPNSANGLLAAVLLSLRFVRTVLSYFQTIVS